MGRFFTLLLLICASVYSAATVLPPLRHTIETSAPEVSGAGVSTPADTFPANDSLPPVITCAPNVTLQIASSNCDTAYTYAVTAEDEQPGVIVAQVSGIHSGDPFPAGTTTNLFVAVDAAGNTASCAFSVTVTPAPGPMTLFCREKLTVNLGPDCTVAPTAAQVLQGAIGCPSEYVLEADLTMPFGNGPWVPAAFSQADRNKTYQIRVTSMITNNKCWGEVTIRDSLPPVLDCPEVNVPCALPTAHLTPAFLKDSLGISTGMPIVLENCPGNPVLSFVDVATNLPCDSPGTVTGYIRRFWTALDASNNVATCVQTINRHRSLADVLFPIDVEVSCANPDTTPAHTGGPYLQVGSRQYDLNTAGFCELDAFFDDTLEALCGGGRRIRRTWTVRDACLPDEPPATGVQYIDVADLDGPVFQCPDDTILLASPQNCLATIDLPDLVVGDACSWVSDVQAIWIQNDSTNHRTGAFGDYPGNNPSASDTLVVFGEVTGYPVGVSSILYVATDVCGNSASCEVTLHVWDGTPPAATCDSLLLVFLSAQGTSSMTATMPDDGSTDDCGALSFKVRRQAPGACAQPDTLFNDYLNFCCSDSGDSVPVVLRVYDVSVPPGVVPDTFASTQYSDCITHVAVLDANGPDCTAPADTVVDCLAFDPGLAAYGNAVFSCRVDSMAIELDYSAFDTVCNSGMIARTYRVYDDAGQSGQCAQHITVTGLQNYWVKFPDDVVAYMCDSSGLYGIPEFSNLSCENMVSDYSDEIFTVVPDACLKIERTWTVYNACAYNADGAVIDIPNPNPSPVANHPDNLPGPIVSAAGAPAPWTASSVKITPAAPLPTDFSIYWDADANAYRFKQIIKIIDTEEPLVSDCPAGALPVQDVTPNDPLLWNEPLWYSNATNSHDLCDAPVDLCITATDQCSGADLDIQYLLYLDLDDDGMQETVVSSTNLPGFNNVNFGNANTPNFSGGQPRAFDERPVPANQKFGFAMQTTAGAKNRTACVRWNNQLAPAGFVIPQIPHGTHKIRWTVQDKCGNETTCQYFFTIEDGNGLCVPTDVTVSGLIQTEKGDGVSNVAVALEGTHPTLPDFTLYALTDDFGAYTFTVPTGASFSVTPYRDDDPLNGVSTFDLLLINKHVLGLEPLPSPYKIVAADANDSRSVSTFDVVEFRKLILGIYQMLPNAPSWRFIQAGYDFPNPANPFQEIFPEAYSVVDIQPADPAQFHFTGIKTGDENGNVIPNIQNAQPEDRAVLPLTLQDALLRPGATLRTPVYLSDAAALQGLQFALRFDPAVLSIAGVHLNQRLLRQPAGEEAYTAQPRPGLRTLSWDNHAAPALQAGEPVFYLDIQALQAVQLSRALAFEPARLQPEAYLAGKQAATGVETRAPGFEFTPAPASGPTEVFAPAPNPSAGGPVYFPVALAEATAVRLELFDATGRAVYVAEVSLPEGLHRLEIPAAAFGGASGVLAYRVQAGAVAASGKLVRG